MHLSPLRPKTILYFGLHGQNEQVGSVRFKFYCTLFQSLKFEAQENFYCLSNCHYCFVSINTVLMVSFDLLDMLTREDKGQHLVKLGLPKHTILLLNGIAPSKCSLFHSCFFNKCKLIYAKSPPFYGKSDPFEFVPNSTQ